MTRYRFQRALIMLALVLTGWASRPARAADGYFFALDETQSRAILDFEAILGDEVLGQTIVEPALSGYIDAEYDPPTGDLLKVKLRGLNADMIAEEEAFRINEDFDSYEGSIYVDVKEVRAELLKESIFVDIDSGGGATLTGAQARISGRIDWKVKLEEKDLFDDLTIYESSWFREDFRDTVNLGDVVLETWPIDGVALDQVIETRLEIYHHENFGADLPVKIFGDDYAELDVIMNLQLRGAFRVPELVDAWLRAFGFAQGWDPQENPRFLADVDGDGFDDIVGFGNKTLQVSLVGESSFLDPAAWLANFTSKQGWRPDRHPRLVGDVNGDGLADLAGFGDKGVLVALSEGDRFANPVFAVGDFGSKKGWRVDRHPRFLADVNGDGRKDVVGFGDKGVLVALARAGDDAFGPTRMWVANFGYAKGWQADRHPRLLADVDGDGRQDVVGFGDRGVLVSLSDGTRFEEPFLAVADYGSRAGWQMDRHPRFLADVTADGRADIVGFDDQGVWVSTARGNGTMSKAALWLEAFGAKDGWSAPQYLRLVEDFDGDHRADILAFDDQGTLISLCDAGGDGFDTPTALVDTFGVNQGWSAERHLRLIGKIDNLETKAIVGFKDDGVFVY